MTRRPLVVAAAAALSFALVACGDGSKSSDEPAAPIPAVNATTADLLPTDAAELPQFDASTFDSLLQELHGTPVLVNVWGSWCGPCRDEAATLAAAHDRYGHEVQFLGVDILDARGSARGFMSEYGWTYPSVFDPPGAIRDSLGLLGQPVTLLYDRSGEIVKQWVGPVPKGQLDPALEGVASA